MILEVSSKGILFVGDPHANSSTPASRIDDYPTTFLGKLEQVLNIAIQYSITVVVIAGDVFHKNQQTNLFLNNVFSVFKRFKDNGIRVFSIYGNHDLAYDSMDYADRSPLGLLQSAGLIQHISFENPVVVHTEYRDFELYGFDYPVPLQPASIERNSIKIAIAHRFYKNSLDKSSLTQANVEALGYQIMVLGHDHVQYPNEWAGNTLILRPGSLTRGTSHQYNMERPVSVDLVCSSPTGISLNRINLVIQPPDRIYSTAVLMKKAQPGDLQVVEAIDNLLDNMQATTSGGSVYDVLDAKQIPPHVKSMIESYLAADGFIRKSIPLPNNP